ncbi:MAG: hypothetical protein HC844_07085 [Tabrizicola sp.]|nr:hypothetical protein [Tabrizicola sp.]
MKTATVYAKAVSVIERQTGTPLSEDGGKAAALFLLCRVERREIVWSTAKHYASAVRWFLRLRLSGVSAFDEVWAAARSVRPTAKRGKRPSRKARITAETLRSLLALASVRDGGSHRAAVSVFHASTLFGLRPCEWATATWADEAKRVLVIANAKTASRVMLHGPFTGRLWVRGNGSVRRLVLTEEGIAAGVREVVDSVLEAERQWPWQAHRFSLYHAFRSVVREASKRGEIPARLSRLTIYSARHQFASDAKKALDVSSGEVAAAMGHSAVRTAVASYGRRSNGGSFAPVARPDAASVAAVRDLRLRPALPVPRAVPAGPSPSR